MSAFSLGSDTSCLQRWESIYDDTDTDTDSDDDSDYSA